MSHTGEDCLLVDTLPRNQKRPKFGEHSTRS
jgi:hypothetical protein